MNHKLNSTIDKLDTFGNTHPGFLNVVLIACAVVVTLCVVKMAFFAAPVRTRPRLSYMSKSASRAIDNGNSPRVMDRPRVAQPAGFVATHQGRLDLSPHDLANSGFTRDQLLGAADNAPMG